MLLQVVAYEMEELEKHGLLDATAPAELVCRINIHSRHHIHTSHASSFPMVIL